MLFVAARQGNVLFIGTSAANCIAKPVSGNVYNIVNEGSGLHLAVASNSTKDGASVIQSTPTSAAGQHVEAYRPGEWLMVDTANEQQQIPGRLNWSTAPERRLSNGLGVGAAISNGY